MRTVDVFIGWDEREAEVADVCRFSIEQNTHGIRPRMTYLKLPDVRDRGLYYRPTEMREGKLWDTISAAPMSTEFAISRFLAPKLSTTPWALFCDCDFLWLADMAQLLELADPRYALMCVKHNHQPTETRKMDGQSQLNYKRKNWSSLILWNCRHPSNKRLTVDVINTVPGRDLHRFFWLDDSEIGGLPEGWNWLEGHSDPAIAPRAVHYTRGGPWFSDWRNVAYADLWLEAREAMLQDAEPNLGAASRT